MAFKKSSFHNFTARSAKHVTILTTVLMRLKLSKVSAPVAISALILAATLKIQNFSFATFVKKGSISCDVVAIYGTSWT